MSDLLFGIIHSMSKNEKGFFKKASRLHSVNGGKSYLRLFDVIERMSEADDEKLRKQVKSFIPPALLPATKNYLKNAILKSLRQFKETVSPEMEMNTRLSNIEILFRKRLVGHCCKELVAIRRLMESTELYNYFHIIAYWEKQILNDSERISSKELVSAALAQEEMENIRRLANIAAYDRLAYRMYSIMYANSDSTTASVCKSLGNLMADRMLFSEEKALTVTTKIIYNNIHSKYAEFKNDKAGMLRHLARVTLLFSENVRYKQAHISKFMNALYNHAKACAWSGNEAYSSLYETLRTIPETRDQSFSAVFLRVHKLLLLNLRTLHLFYENRFEEMIREAEHCPMEELDQIPAGYAMVRMEIQCLFALGFFRAGQFRAALRWTNLSLMNKNLRHDLHIYMRLLLLAVHYELENETLLSSELRSVKRIFEKSAKTNCFENHFTAFVKLLLSLRKEEPGIQKKLAVIYSNCVREAEAEPVTAGLNYNASLIYWMQQKLGKARTTGSGDRK